jgi:hypothetical protein
MNRIALTPLSKDHDTKTNQAREYHVKRHKIVQESRKNEDQNSEQDRQQGSNV